MKYSLHMCVYIYVHVCAGVYRGYIGANSICLTYTLHDVVYITTNSIIDKFQSAYLPHRSTEPALNLIINDLLISLDNKAPATFCYFINPVPLTL